MKTKLEMAHEWAMKHGDAETVGSRQNMVKYAWEYADAMQAEAEKRGKEKQSEYVFEAIDEWQPDWSQAPEWANWWAMDENRDCYWHSCVDSPFIGNGVFEVGDPKGHTYDAPSFGYTGDWRKSLRKRPE